jgi:hypothetical protein
VVDGGRGRDLARKRIQLVHCCTTHVLAVENMPDATLFAARSYDQVDGKARDCAFCLGASDDDR